MPLVFGIADVHLGNHSRHGGPIVAGLNTRARHIVRAIQDAVSSVREQGGVLVVAGDLFDVESPEPQIIRAAQEALTDVPVIVLKGNHDSHSSEPGDHALGPLAPVCTVVEYPQIITLEDEHPVNVWCVPFQAGPAKAWLPRVLEDLAATRTVDATDLLVVHLGIQDRRTAKFLHTADDAINVHTLHKLCGRHSIDFVFAGNWHERRFWGFDDGIGVQQIGALVPTGWDNEGLTGYGGLATFDPERVGKDQLMQEIRGPRFVKVSGGVAECDAVIKRATWPELLYLQATVDPDELGDVTDHLAAIRNADGLAAAEVRAESAYREAAAATAAHSARNADTIDDAVEVFVRRMPLRVTLERDEEAAFRDRVLQRARDLLVEAMTR